MPSIKGRPKRIPQLDPDELDPNRVIAFNLKVARDAMRPKWSQRQAAEKMGWTPTNWSNAERSAYAEPQRVRNFTITDLYKFAKIFGVPINWFLVPPLPHEAQFPAPSADYFAATLDDETGFVDRRMAAVAASYPESFYHYMQRTAESQGKQEETASKSSANRIAARGAEMQREHEAAHNQEASS